MADRIFDHPRLANIYDALDPDRSDLGPYLAMVDEFGANKIADLGCGTGVLALLLRNRGLDVIGVDPAGGSLGVAKAKPGGDDVRWIHGDATNLPSEETDLVLMTGNAAQAVTSPIDWLNTLSGVYRSLLPGGHFVFETRDPSRRAWEEWTKEATQSTTCIEDVGEVETWVEQTAVTLPLVSFRWTFIFKRDGQVLTSDSTLRFRDQNEVEKDLRASGFDVEDVRGSPDRPGREFVFVARKPSAIDQRSKASNG